MSFNKLGLRVAYNDAFPQLLQLEPRWCSESCLSAFNNVSSLSVVMRNGARYKLVTTQLLMQLSQVYIFTILFLTAGAVCSFLIFPLCVYLSYCVFGRPYYRSRLWHTVSSVCLSVCLSVVCDVLYPGKTAGPICMKFSGKLWSDHATTCLHFVSIRVNRAMPRC